MEIAFRSLSLRAVCVSEAKSIGLYGVDVAQSLKRRLADLRAADSIDELSVWNIAEVPAAGGATMSLELAGDCRRECDAASGGGWSLICILDETRAAISR